MGRCLDLIEGKVIKVGNSTAISISKKDLEKNKLKLNQKIKFAILEKNKDKIIDELLGIARGAKIPFKREKDREF